MERTLKDRIKRAAKEEVPGLPVRWIDLGESIIWVGSGSVTRESISKIVKQTGAMHELRDQNFLHDRLRCSNEAVFADHWKEVALEVFRDHIETDGLIKSHKDQKIIIRAIQTVSGFIKGYDWLGQTEERDIHCSNTFEIYRGSVKVNDNWYNLRGSCPANSIAVDWYDTAKKVQERIRKEREITAF